MVEEEYVQKVTEKVVEADHKAARRNRKWFEHRTQFLPKPVRWLAMSSPLTRSMAFLCGLGYTIK